MHRAFDQFKTTFIQALHVNTPHFMPDLTEIVNDKAIIQAASDDLQHDLHAYFVSIPALLLAQIACQPHIFI